MSAPIPTNLVMGFLGVGKTTAIRGLLERRPRGEQWAVLVNELGRVGIDGELLAGGDVAVKQVPGGCLCCVSSAAFGVGLVQLIRAARPRRILIEPTGIGHPRQVIAQLTADEMARTLDLRAAVALVDARKLGDPRYREHPAFVDQLEMADVVVANKADTYGEAEREAFAELARGFEPPKAALVMAERGRFPLELLDRPHLDRAARFPAAHAHAHDEHTDAAACPLPAGPWLRLEGYGGGAYTVGWRIDPGVVFRRAALEAWLEGLAAHRLKGVVHTDAGWLGLNQADGDAVWEPMAAAAETRLEIIMAAPGEGLDAAALEAALRACSS